MTLHTTKTTQQEGVSLPSATRYRSLRGKEQNEMQWHVLRSGTDKSAHRQKTKQNKTQQQKNISKQIALLPFHRLSGNYTNTLCISELYECAQNWYDTYILFTATGINFN